MFPAVNHFKDPGLYLITKVPVSIREQRAHTGRCLHVSLYMTGKMQFTTSRHVLQEDVCTMKHSYD